ncbi:endonuclease domain-containing protein [Streptomyces sp. NPDC000229]|uniref:endonuclease domain-containing protein n=1 Tax=Streptomyces sp. NPDC000229 TaxID=3154247 RepID=UPI0033257576
MLMKPEAARTTFSELTQGSAVPLQPDVLLRTKYDVRRHGHVLIGDIALRCYKHKGRWMYDERDIRSAGHAFAGVTDLGELVEVQLPPYRRPQEGDPDEWDHADWRLHLLWLMLDAAHNKLVEEKRPFNEWGAWRTIGDNGLPIGLTMDEFVARHSDVKIAGTLPLRLLTWSGTQWLLPRAYVGLLDRWQLLDNELSDRARLCSRCGSQGPRWSGWRTPTTTGYVTLCPPCSGETYQKYQGHLRGVLYEALRRLATRADAYLCRLCGESRASVWDHCHEHGFVRGPLCASCNTFEGKGVPYHFLQQQGAALHLLECSGCLQQRTLPRRFGIGVVRAHLEDTERHGRCRSRPYARELEHAHGVHRFELYCSGSHLTSREWTRDVTVAEAAQLVRAFVTKTLDTHGSKPSVAKSEV